jgi:hypothetical protein
MWLGLVALGLVLGGLGAVVFVGWVFVNGFQSFNLVVRYV